MRAIFVLTIVLTIVIILLKYKRDKDGKKLLISIASFIFIISMAVVGNLTRQVIPIFIAHLILLMISWGALIWYLMRGRYYWWLILSPVVTIALFLILETLIGAGHEYLGEMT